MIEENYYKNVVLYLRGADIMPTESGKSQEMVVNIPIQSAENIPEQIILRLNKKDTSTQLRNDACLCQCGSSSGGGSGN
jgi:hypothetical protein